MLAASIAAYYNKARSSENVAVDYTLVKYVKKPSGKNPVWSFLQIIALFMSAQA